MTLVALSLVFPRHGAFVAPRIQDWFDRCSPPVRTGPSVRHSTFTEFAAMPSIRSFPTRSPTTSNELPAGVVGSARRTWHTSGRGIEQLSHIGLIDVLPYGRQEDWQDSPDGWPRSATYCSSQDIAAAYGPDA